MGVLGFILGVIWGVLLALGITAKLIVSSNYLGDKKGTRFDYGSKQGAFYHSKRDGKGSVTF